VTQQAVKTKRIHAEIKELADGRLNPSDRLRSEPEVSERFQGNRAFVRETIRDLEAPGLPTSKNGAGPHVPTGAVDLLSPLVSSILQPKDVRLDLFETHEIIESEIATLAAKGAKSEGIPRGERIPEEHARRIAQGDAGVEAVAANPWPLRPLPGREPAHLEGHPDEVFSQASHAAAPCIWSPPRRDTDPFLLTQQIV
jgi:GntR family transcriptional regulator, transcriptional repressor for pyruvate dehydrogenase complex